VTLVTNPEVRGRPSAQAIDEAKRAKLAPLLDLVGSDLQKVNEEILRRMDSEVPLIPELAGHLIASGGKRIRPMLTLGAARLCGYGGGRHILLAACVEFIHTATLLHDDVVDESDMRRGRATANTVWGNQPSVLVGDFLFSRSFQLMVETRSIEVLRILANAASVIAEGEVLQLTTQNDVETTQERYLQVVEAKTAALFRAACRVGAVIANRPVAEADALEDFGLNLGVAFQLVDDALDYAAEQQELGKSIGDDFREGKMTLPVVLAMQRGTAEERAFWTRTMADLEQDDADLGRAIDLLERHNAVADAIALAGRYGERAIAALDIFPGSETRNAMQSVVEFCIERRH